MFLRAHVWRYRGSLGSPQDRDQGARRVRGRSVGRADLSIREGLEGEGVALFPKRHRHSRPAFLAVVRWQPAALLRKRPRRKLGSWGLGLPPSTTRPIWRREDLRYSSQNAIRYGWPALEGPGRAGLEPHRAVLLGLDASDGRNAGATRRVCQVAAGAGSRTQAVNNELAALP